MKVTNSLSTSQIEVPEIRMPLSLSLFLSLFFLLFSFPSLFSSSLPSFISSSSLLSFLLSFPYPPLFPSSFFPSFLENSSLLSETVFWILGDLFKRKQCSFVGGGNRSPVFSSQCCISFTKKTMLFLWQLNLLQTHWHRKRERSTGWWREWSWLNNFQYVSALHWGEKDYFLFFLW